MERSQLQQQLNELRADLHRAQNLFGPTPMPPPENIPPDEDMVKKWIH
jgi:hypothetical protein